MRKSILALAALPLLLLAPACGGGSGGGGTAPTAPSNLTYPNLAPTYTVGVAITDLVPTFDGTADAFAVTLGTLPTGLALDPLTGVLSGTPTVATIGAQVVTIEASLTGVGSDSVSLSISVLAPPSGLTYGDDTPTFARTIQIAELTPTFSGSADTFAVTAGALPAGLSLDTNTGVISGTPTATTAGAVDVTVQATAVGVGSDTVVLSITVDEPTSRALYVANETTGTIGIYDVSPTGGLLRAAGFANTSINPRSLVLTPDLAHLYAVDAGTGEVAGFAVDPDSAQLTELANSPWTMAGAGLSPLGMAVSSSGHHLYVANTAGDSISAFSIAPDGDLTELVGSPFLTLDGARNLAALSIDGIDYLVAVAENEVASNLLTYQIQVDGTLVQVDADLAGTQPRDLAVSPDGAFVFVVNLGSQDVATFAVGAGGTLVETLASPVALPALVTSPEAIAVAKTSSGTFLYVNNIFPGDLAQFSVAGDGTVAALTTAEIDVTGTGGITNDTVVGPYGDQVWTVDGTNREVLCWTVSGTGELAEATGIPRMRTHSGPRSAVVLPAVTAPTWSTPFLYAANNGTAGVVQLSVDAAGNLAPIAGGFVAAGAQTSDVVLDPSGDFAYVANFGDIPATLQTFPVGADGALDALGATNLAVPGKAAFGLAVRRNGDALYRTGGFSGVDEVASYPLAAGAIGAQTASQATGATPLFPTIDPTGRYLYVPNSGASSVSQYTLGHVGGVVAPSSTPSAASGLSAQRVALHPSGRYAYVACQGANGVDAGDIVRAYRVSSVDGTLSPMTASQISADGDPRAVAVSPNGRFLAVGAFTGQSVRLHLINSLSSNLVEDGSLSVPVGAPVALGARVRDLAFSADGSLLFVGLDNGDVVSYSFDGLSTLTLVDTESTGGNLYAIEPRLVVE